MSCEEEALKHAIKHHVGSFLEENWEIVTNPSRRDEWPLLLEKLSKELLLKVKKAFRSSLDDLLEEIAEEKTRRSNLLEDDAPLLRFPSKPE